MNRYMLIDGNNLLHAANSAPTLKIGETPVQAIIGFLKTMRKLLATYGQIKPVVLWDGASWRSMNYPEYKQNRQKKETKADIEQLRQKEMADKQAPAIKKALELLGVAQVRASNMEADDLAAILGDRYVSQGASVVLISGDRDWIQLVGPKMTWFDPIRDRKIRNIEDLQAACGYKLRDFKQFLEMKCLMGDLGDNISGVGGIGEKGAQQFLEQFGSVYAFNAGVMDKSIDVASLPKKLRDFALDEEKQIIFNRNVRLMDLRTPVRPAPVNLTVNKGTPDKDRFQTFCDRFLFKSITKQFDHWLSVFPEFTHLQEELAA